MTDLNHYIAVFNATTEIAEEHAEDIAEIRAAADPIAAAQVSLEWGYVEDEIEQVVDLWCRMHESPLAEAWRLAAVAHGGYATKEQAEALRALVGMVPAVGKP